MPKKKISTTIDSIYAPAWGPRSLLRNGKIFLPSETPFTSEGYDRCGIVYLENSLEPYKLPDYLRLIKNRFVE